MAILLLAVGDDDLAASLERWIEAAGHGVVRVMRPLAVLTEARKTAWDAVLVDDSSLGQDVLVVLAGVQGDTPAIGLGMDDLCLFRSLPLPIDGMSLVDILEGVARRAATTMQFRPDRRLVQANGSEVALTRSEYRLLEVLWARRPAEVSIAEAMQAVWGASEGTGTPAPLRSHIRNLRSKLARIGLSECLRSRRGRGYALTL